MIKSYFQKNILSLIAIIIGVLLFIGIIKLSDIAVCQEYKLFKKNGLKVKALVDHFSSNRAQHYVSYKFELNGDQKAFNILLRLFFILPK